MSALVFDLETTALASSLVAPYPEAERPHPGNFKDPVKIAEWRERDREKWAAELSKTCALSPRLGRIVAAGWNSEEYATPGCWVAEYENEEATLLRELWNRILAADGQIITFNGLGLDVPFFLFRSMVNGVKSTVPTKVLRDWTRRYSYGPHFDVRAVLTGWDNRTTGTLTDWATCLGIPCDDTTKGSDITDLYNAGDFDAIAEHCRADVATTKQLYERVSTIYGTCGGSW